MLRYLFHPIHQNFNKHFICPQPVLYFQELILGFVFFYVSGFINCNTNATLQSLAQLHGESYL
jgi:hypothetical protein